MGDGCCGKWMKKGKFCDDCPLRKKLTKEERRKLAADYKQKHAKKKAKKKD